MSKSVYKSEKGKEMIHTLYRGHLNSPLGAGLTQRIINTDRGRTYVLEKSSPGKPPLIMLHGSMSNSASWLGIIPSFARDFSIYCVDIPGEPGLSNENRLPLNSQDPEQWLGDVLTALKLEKCAFLGMSLGGWYITNYTVKHPEKVTAVSLISTGGIAPQRYSFIFKAILCMMLGKKGQDLLNRMICHKVEIPREIQEFQALTTRYFNPVTEPLPLFSDDQLKQLTMPLQYFGGDHDVLLRTEESVKRLRELAPHAEAHLLPDTGHAITDRFEEAREFLLRNAQ